MKKIILFLVFVLLFSACGKKAAKVPEQGEGKSVDLELLKKETRDESSGEKTRDESSQVDDRKENRVDAFQYAMFRRSDWKPIYSVLVEEFAYDKWNEIVFEVDEKTVGYDAFGGISLWKDIDILRFQFIVASAGQKTLLYVDDVLLENDSEKVLNLDFETDVLYVYVSKGTALEDSNTIVKKEGRECLKFYGLSETSYDSTGVEIQFDLARALDLSGGDYRISLKYYIPSKIE